MKKKLLETVAFSIILSSGAYAEYDADRMREKREKAELQKKMEEQVVVEENNFITDSVGSTGLSSEEEKEAYEALERARDRIKKEDEEKAKVLEMEKEQENMVEEQKIDENSISNESMVVEKIGLSPEEEKEAYEALERARDRIRKEDEERVKALQIMEEQQK